MTFIKNMLKISVSKHPKSGGDVTCKKVTIREKLLHLLLGDKQHITVLIPGDDVDELAICKKQKGGIADGQG